MIGVLVTPNVRNKNGICTMGSPCWERGEVMPNGWHEVVCGSGIFNIGEKVEGASCTTKMVYIGKQIVGGG